jgi:SpoOM protein
MSTIGALRVELFEDRPYALGETVRADIQVDVEVERHVTEVVVTLSWRVRGAQREERQHVTHRVLSGGLWEPGRKVRLPVELALPVTGPLSMPGELVAVEWIVQARVRMGVMGEAVTERVLVVDGPIGAPVRLPGVMRWRGVPDLLAQPFVVVVLSLCLASFLTLPLQSLTVALFLFQSGGQGTMLGLFFGGGGTLLVAALAIPLIKLWRNALTIWPTMGARIGFTPADVSAADELVVTVVLPKNRERVRRVHATLLCHEHAWPGLRRKDGRTHQRTEVAFEVAWDGRAYVGRVRVPADAPTSLLGHRHAVEWSVRVLLEIEGLPDRTLERELTVRGRPPRAL